ncbi:hypothetical protein OE88DRAFT_1736268 [Heliocybe sulcata]|uniref:Uncharacterized protein n=1 Tax=Heliocybe sulcata TaxID=5364 RepID=A0A5C3MWR6_9AGAM|nr:hypothetical protein OE88DRAFT_1736268 [Heliocybe sulcata]
MAETMIANIPPEDLRAIVRTLLATHSPTLASSFTHTARARLSQVNARPLPDLPTVFEKAPQSNLSAPAPGLDDVLRRVRALYGAGMGLASLDLLAKIVRATWGLRWENEGVMADALAMIDADITQAIQSSKEEIEEGRVFDLATARAVAADISQTLEGSESDIAGWGGEFPFERAAASLVLWTI